jgi:hypothetical protein
VLAEEGRPRVGFGPVMHIAIGAWPKRHHCSYVTSQPMDRLTPIYNESPAFPEDLYENTRRSFLGGSNP